MAELVSLEITAQTGKDELIKLYDQTLINHTKTIQSYRDAGNLTILGIAEEMRELDEDGSYTKAGFKTVAEYASVCFDYKRQTVQLYIKAATYFLTKTDGKLALADTDLPWFSMGQMIELLPLCDAEGLEGVKQALADGTINQRMSAKKLRTAVKSYLALDTTAKVEDADDTVDTDKNTTDETKADMAADPKELLQVIIDRLAELQSIVPVEKSSPIIKAISALGEMEL